MLGLIRGFDWRPCDEPIDEEIYEKPRCTHQCKLSPAHHDCSFSRSLDRTLLLRYSEYPRTSRRTFLSALDGHGCFGAGSFQPNSFWRANVIKRGVSHRRIRTRDWHRDRIN